MSPWELLFVPASLLLLSLLLAGVSWFEQRVLSPRSLIVHAARSRHAEPDHAEAFIAAQSQTLLDAFARRSPRPPAPIAETNPGEGAARAEEA